MKRVLTMAQLLLHVPESRHPLRIGWLSQVGDILRVSFADDHVRDPDRPTLSQLYKGEDEAQTQAILRAVDDERLVRIGRLPTFFSNLLPEGANRSRLAAQRGVDEDDELELLAAAGHDLTGALEVVPAPDVPGDVLQLHASKDSGPIEPASVAAPVDGGFSVDGVQTKFSMLRDGRRYTMRRGTEAGDYIAKLPSTVYPDLVLNEGACMGLARAVGVTTAKTEVRPMAELDVPDHVKAEFDEFLLVERFDRTRRPDGTTRRIHFEELIQAIGYDARRKYQDLPAAMQTLLELLRLSTVATLEDFDEFFRRWTVHALLGNTDAHSKNWGLLYEDGRNARLAPAYDIVCISAYFDPERPNDLAVNRKMDASLRLWNEDRAEQLAKAAGYLQPKRARRVVRETRAAAVERWPSLLEQAPKKVRETVSARLKELVPPARPAAASRAGGASR